jgi:hypothetical protein
MNLTNLWVVITTINEPTKAIHKYIELSKVNRFTVLIVGDESTPDSYQNLECEFLSFKSQKSLESEWGLNFPSRHYARKNFGYFYAISRGAEFIFDTDDDNIPYEDFGSYLVRKSTVDQVNSAGFVNAYRYFLDAPIWPRGFPLRHIIKSYELGEVRTYKAELDLKKNIVQFMADGEPDVDAIYRLIDNKKRYFRKDGSVLALSREQFCPYNSQATLIPRKAFLSLYLPFTAPFRMTDIWRSFMFQTCRNFYDCDLIFSGPIVYQDRNPHDYLADFKDELLGYLHNEEICRFQLGPVVEAHSPFKKFYSRLVDMNLLKSSEIEFAECWELSIQKYL